MSSTTHTPSEALPPPSNQTGAWAWLKTRLFSSPLNILIIMGAYLTVSLSISIFMNWYNKRIALVER